MIGNFIRSYSGVVGYLPANLCKTDFDVSIEDCATLFKLDSVFNTLARPRINVIGFFGVTLC